MNLTINMHCDALYTLSLSFVESRSGFLSGRRLVAESSGTSVLPGSVLTCMLSL